MHTPLNRGALGLALVLILGACSGPSAEVLAAERLVEEQLADSLDLVLDATCQEPNPPTVITCSALTPDGAEVLIEGTVGADELSLRTTNVITEDQLDTAEGLFAESEAATSLPAGSIACGPGTVIADDAGSFQCAYVGESGKEAIVTVAADGFGTDDVTFSFEVDMSAAMAAEGTIERLILPELGFEGVRAECAQAGDDGEPFQCGAELADGRLLEFVAFEEGDEVQVAAANVLAPEELAKLDEAFAETVASEGLTLPVGRLDCGSDIVILDTTATFVCAYSAEGHVPVEVTVTAVGLGLPDARFDFAFAELG